MSLDAVLQACGEGFLLVFSWPNILYPIVGTGVAMLVSAMPGVSGLTLMALAIPLTLDWEPVPVMLLFGALVGGATFMGFGHGHRSQHTGESLQCGYFAGWLPNGVPGEGPGRQLPVPRCPPPWVPASVVVVLILLLPFMHRAVLLLGPAELLVLVVWGDDHGGRCSGTFSAQEPCLVRPGPARLLRWLRPPHRRVSFSPLGTPSLQDGLSFVPIFLGIFGVAEMIHQLVQGRRTVSGETRIEGLSGSVGEGFSAIFRNFGLFLRCSTIGTLVGMIPGVGGTVAGFVAYGHAVRSSRSETDRFGRGDIRGVLAPETANDAKDAGALVSHPGLRYPGRRWDRPAAGRPRSARNGAGQGASQLPIEPGFSCSSGRCSFPTGLPPSWASPALDLLLESLSSESTAWRRLCSAFPVWGLLPTAAGSRIFSWPSDSAFAGIT